jgi:uncharacterized protein (DUF849 family)
MEKSEDRRIKQSKSLIEVNKAKREELLEYINKIEIKIPKMPIKELRVLAVKHYNTLWSMRGKYDKVATINDDEEFLDRVSVNMLRHELECYEKELDKLFGKIGRAEGYSLLKNRINQEIVKTYPYFNN